MDLTYTLQDAQAWAAFSGDYNPLHFDLQQVRKIGMEQLSVHGMRAMLDMKHHLSAALLTTAPVPGGYIFRARMRQPVLCQTPYQLQIASKGHQLTGTLLDKTTQERCFSSTLTSAPLLPMAAGVKQHSLTLAEVMALARLFPGETAQSAQTWGFFDAVLFQLLVTSPETLAMLTSVLPELAAATLSDVFAQIPVVQTHHETQFSAKLLTPDPHFHIAERLYYTISPMLIMGDKNSGLVLRAEIEAGSLSHPLITTAVTLKTWPLV